MINNIKKNEKVWKEEYMRWIEVKKKNRIFENMKWK